MGHRSAITRLLNRVRRKRQRLPPCLLIENASVQLVFVGTFSAEAFPIKASDNPEAIVDALVLKVDVLHEICHIVPSALLLVLGMLSLVVPIPHHENHSLKIGDAKIGVQNETSEKLPPAVGIALLAGGVLTLIFASRKTS